MSQVRRSLLVAALCVAFVAPLHAQEQATASAAATARPALPAQLADFDAYVDNVRKTFDVPGIAVAIVKDGEVVLERGYGPRTLDIVGGYGVECSHVFVCHVFAPCIAPRVALIERGAYRFIGPRAVHVNAQVRCRAIRMHKPDTAALVSL